MRIITISREFGSGGRELGKRLADALGMPCYHLCVNSSGKEIKLLVPGVLEYITKWIAEE